MPKMLRMIVGIVVGMLLMSWGLRQPQAASLAQFLAYGRTTGGVNVPIQVSALGVVKTSGGGGGGGTPGSPTTSVQFNSSGSFGGDASITISGTPKALVVTNSGSAFGSLAVANNNDSFPYADSGTGFTIAQSTADPTYGYNTFLVYTKAEDGGQDPQSTLFDVDLKTAVTTASGLTTNIFGNGHAAESVYGNQNFIDLTGSTLTGSTYGYFNQTRAGSGSGAVYGIASQTNFTNTRTGEDYGFWGKAVAQNGSSTATYYGFYQAAPSIFGTGAITNFYYFWADSQGVLRIREDATFNSVSQAILALYNPQVTKYTAGAANYERIVQQWESNVATIRTEAGGTGTLRSINLAGNTVQLNGKTITLANSFTTSGNFAVTQTYTGATNVTFPTSGTLGVAPLRGVTGSISGNLTLGTCDTGTATVSGATTGMVATASPTTNPGVGVTVKAYVSASDTVTVEECGLGVITPTSTTFQVAVLQ